MAKVTSNGQHNGRRADARALIRWMIGGIGSIGLLTDALAPRRASATHCAGGSLARPQTSGVQPPGADRYGSRWAMVSASS